MATERHDSSPLEDDPLWYKDAIIYELHVRAFSDSKGDGVGDFRGLTSKLDYLQDLGVTALWLLPFYPSPLRDDGYDIADYTTVHPAYGDLADFKAFLDEAHSRGIRVITELVMNHTSDTHPWFQKARRSPPGSRARDFYVWSDTPEKYKETRIIFQDFEGSNWTYDRVAGAYYWHRFYSHQPDLNFDNPEVRKTMFAMLDYWLKMGVDGMRLDAVPYLYEREGTNCENLPETHEFLRQVRSHVSKKFKNVMFLAEANQWPEDASAYFGQGDECHMNFHFPLMPRMFMALRLEDRIPIIDILEQTPAIPESCQWASFLRNHDELTLEMVTDEERDYMYRVFAHEQQMRINLGIRRRLAPLLGNDRRAIELLNGLLFSLAGTPVVYYGDEIGMGDNVFLGDRNGVRTPMQWSSDRNAGFSRASPQRLYLPVITEPEFHYESVNVEAQQNNPNSLLWFMKRIIGLRKRHKAFGRGTLKFLHPENRKILAFLRQHEGENILVVANLSRYVQAVELDLAEFKGMAPVEMFGHTEFPHVGEGPYFLTLGQHAIYWFIFRQVAAGHLPFSVGTPEAHLPLITVAGKWSELFAARSKAKLERVLPDFLSRCRWFQGKARTIQAVHLGQPLPIGGAQGPLLTLITVNYIEGEPDIYLLPLIFAGEEREKQILGRVPPMAVIARLRTEDGGGILYDALWDRDFCASLLKSFDERKRFKTGTDVVSFSSTREFQKDFDGAPQGSLEPSNIRGEQTNSSVVYGWQFILKFFRRVDRGINPDLELGRFLTEKTGFKHIAPTNGALELLSRRGEPMTFAILQKFVKNEGDAWSYTLDSLKTYYASSLAQKAPPPSIGPSVSIVDLAGQSTPDGMHESGRAYIGNANLLGRRTGEMHLALGSSTDDAHFIPEAFTTLYQRSVYQSMHNTCRQVFPQVRRALKSLSEANRPDAAKVLSMEEAIRSRLRAVMKRKVSGMRIRTHGDYHLGQVLFTGTDFVILDFEGEPLHSLGQRRLKRSPLRDVAGMLRSFQYAAFSAILAHESAGELARKEDSVALQAWAKLWESAVCGAFLKGYLETMGNSPLLPSERDELKLMLGAFMLEKAIYELGYELNNRPAWVNIPVHGILQIMESAE